ncbi:hypothetical protein CEUSTIGMA_g11637.t1 [Chlamydomonas eustigma]|uniref:Thiamine pyrophosphokinase n=1 Tax=Chlamydomonas eustigma TaxID=1157962 RepID=A0A250XMA4_9CHLO|nr:hypothetical protein CEUSTIGMA_g11637.t1 [Chlamydomonas eustigma]|eukprot:GAX84214.1 hypothetical protein CEUSTIGMA_g11637.t1 [Chlamydomonas eustigma]
MEKSLETSNFGEPDSTRPPIRHHLEGIEMPTSNSIVSSKFLDFDSVQDKNMQTFLVVLNFSLPTATARLWPKTAYKICADGGTNRLFDALPTMLGISGEEVNVTRSAYLPDIVIGDLDSIREDVRTFYSSKDVPILDLSHDQDTTDLGKCLMHIDSLLASSQQSCRGSAGHVASSISDWSTPESGAKEVMTSPFRDHQIIVVGAMGGRLDHILSNLNALYQFSHLKITLWGEGNLVRLLPKGRSLITPLKGLEGPSCGLVPLSGPAVATSSGLKWNLQDTKMEVSGLISTCNVIESEEVIVTTDRELLWITAVSEDWF